MMAVDNCSKFKYALIIETDQYAGNFERELCAYATGAVGECEVGEEEAEIFREEVPEEFQDLCDITDHISDDRGCHRPASIWRSSEGYDGYGAVAIFLGQPPKQDELNLISARIRAYPAFAGAGLNIVSIRLIQRKMEIVDSVIQTL
jgi:hypothetical protein